MTLLQQLVWEKRTEDPYRLAIQKPILGISMQDLAREVQAIQSLREKVPSWYRPGLDFPLALSLEQCSSEETGRFKASLFSGKRMADLTGGLGVDSFCFSKRFDAVEYVEQNPILATSSKHNFQVLGLSNIHVYVGDALSFIQKNKETFDLMYIDPARRDGHQHRVFRLEDCQPDVLTLKEKIFENCPLIILKTAPMLDIKQAIRQLRDVRQVWVVALRDECKEVLYLLERGLGPRPDVPISAVQIQRDGSSPSFDFDYVGEEDAHPALSLPLQFLYEPHAAILKAGAFKSFATHFNLKKIADNTHLYTSDVRVAGVPGRTFEVLHVCKYDKKSVQAVLHSPKAHVSTRNFPEKAEQVRKKLGLQDGGDVYIFAMTGMDGQKLICVTKKISGTTEIP